MVHLLSATTWLTLSPRLVGQTQTIKQHLHLAFLLHSLDNGAPIDEEDMVWRDLVERLEYKHQSIAEVRARFQEVLPEQDVKFRSMDTLESKDVQVSKDINSSLGFYGSVRLSISCTNSCPGKPSRNYPGTVPGWFLDSSRTVPG